MKKIFNAKMIRSGSKVERFLNKAGNELDAFFKFKIVEPMIFLLNTRKEMDMAMNKKTKKWMVGTLERRCIYIFNENVFSKVSNHPKSDFWPVLKHEYCHAYYVQIANTAKPHWLNEGLACHLAGMKKSYKYLTKEQLLGVTEYFNRFDTVGYPVSQFWVEKLLKKFGKTKMLNLIKSLSPDISEKDFAKLFKKIYKISYDKKSFTKMV